jgi:hypothetical protein
MIVRNPDNITSYVDLNAGIVTVQKDLKVAGEVNCLRFHTRKTRPVTLAEGEEEDPEEEEEFDEIEMKFVGQGEMPIIDGSELHGLMYGVLIDKGSLVVSDGIIQTPHLTASSIQVEELNVGQYGTGPKSFYISDNIDEDNRNVYTMSECNTRFGGGTGGTSVFDEVTIQNTAGSLANNWATGYADFNIQPDQTDEFTG